MSHYTVIAEIAHQTSLLAIVSAAMLMIRDAIGENKLLANLFEIEIAIDVNPLAAIARPRLPAIGFAHSGGMDRLFKFLKVDTKHVGSDLVECV